MNVTRVKKTLIKALPYIIIGLILTNFGEAWCLSEGSEAGEKILSFFSMVGVAFRNPAPSFHPMDILIGTLCGAACGLQFMFVVKMLSIFAITRSMVLHDGERMRISNPSWILSLRIM